MNFEKGSILLESLAKGAKSSLICSFLINPQTLKTVLGKEFPFNSLILLSGEKSIEIEESIKVKKFLDSSSIPLSGHSFHSKIYLFEKNLQTGSQLDLIVASFNATSAGLNQNLEFWSHTNALMKMDTFNAKDLADLVLNSEVKIDSIDWRSTCLEEKGQLVVAPALEVLCRLARNGVGLAPGKPRCLSDIIIANRQFAHYDSIFVHTLGNNSLSKALNIMINQAIEEDEKIAIRILCPYHNIEGIRYLHKKCLVALGKKNSKVKIELLTVFPPDFSEKFSDPKRQPFASLDEIAEIQSKDPRLSLKIKLWKKETHFNISELNQNENDYLQNVFLHGKVIIVKEPLVHFYWVHLI